MDAAEKERLGSLGYWVGDYGDYLGLSEAEREHIELRIALCTSVRRLRESKGLTKQALAKKIGATQAVVSKIESGTVEVSLDLMFNAFFSAGGKLADLSARAAVPSEVEAVPAAPKPKSRAKRLVKAKV